MLKLFNSFRKFSSLPLTRYYPTIYALSTPPGHRSAIAVVRISGTHCKYIYHQLTKSNKDPVPRRASLRNLFSPLSEKHHLLDSSLVIYFDSPKTFTGEDILELHLHGGRAVVSGILQAIESLHDRVRGINIRYAQPGEFSQRGFQNGRFDLTQIEGIGGLIDAETETQRKSAVSSFNGENRVRFMNWRKSIVENIAQLTAIIDFGDDTEIEDIQNIFDTVNTNMLRIQTEIKRFVHKIEKSSILQSGIKLVLLGPPNAGKSSLLNSLTNDETSIVSSIPGTTRDSIDVPIDVNGYKVVLCDTAGIRKNSNDQIELQGIRRAKMKSSQSDLVVLLVDASNELYITEDLKDHIKSQLRDKNIIIVVNKSDLVDVGKIESIRQTLKAEFDGQYPVKFVSCLNQTGIEDLIQELTSIFKELSESSDESDPIVVSKRVQEILNNDVLYGIEEFIKFKEMDDVVMASESLTYAAEGIGKITGETVGVEEILGVVFSNFCVGK